MITKITDNKIPSDFLDSSSVSADNDFKLGMWSIHVWGTLGWHDIRQRYRRSVLGPFWFTLSTAIMVVVLGLLYSVLLKQEISNYLPYLAVGLIVWQYMATTMIESCDSFINSAYLIKQIRMPLSIHVWRIAWRNFVIMLHSLPITIIVLVVFGKLPGIAIFLVPAGLLLLLLHSVWIGLILGVLCSRFRDIQPIVNSMVQIIFFFTPVLWMPESLKERAWVAGYNPFYHVIEIVRAPILNRPVTYESWVWSIIILVAGFFLANYIVKQYRNRVPYWL